MYRGVLELTATGIVPDFHRIPFSFVADDSFKSRHQQNLTRDYGTGFGNGNQHKMKMKMNCLGADLRKFKLEIPDFFQK